MKRLWIILLACLLLCGCTGWADGAYYSIERHQEPQKKPEQTIPSISYYSEMVAVVSDMVEQGLENMLISLEKYAPNQRENDTIRAIRYVTQVHPIGAYAVEGMDYEIGSTGGVTALSLTVHYKRNPEEIRAIKRVEDMNQVKELVGKALADCEASLVLKVDWFQNKDFSQMVEDYALENPSLAMEIPVVTVTCYPDTGLSRVVDLRFTYQNSRDDLKTMQKYVRPIFDSAALYVSNEEESAALKYWRLQSFLMERNNYRIETSITPTYSLLRHGVGDSRSFAVVYSAMCRRAGLECLVVSGTCQGEARFWNIVCDNGKYYHLDLLSGGYGLRTDDQMQGYVWDYSAYPACEAEVEVPPETTAPK